MKKRYQVNEAGDYYFTICGSQSDGFTIHWFRKLGWDSVTSAHRSENVSLEELIAFLNDPDSHLDKHRKPGAES